MVYEFCCFKLEVKINNKTEFCSKQIFYISFLCLEKWKPSKCSLNDLFKAVLVGINSSMREPTSQICGGAVLFDFDGLALTHIMQFTPSFAAMILEWVQVSLRICFVRIQYTYLFLLYCFFFVGNFITST